MLRIGISFRYSAEEPGNKSFLSTNVCIRVLISESFPNVKAEGKSCFCVIVKFHQLNGLSICIFQFSHMECAWNRQTMFGFYHLHFCHRRTIKLIVRHTIFRAKECTNATNLYIISNKDNKEHFYLLYLVLIFTYTVIWVWVFTIAFSWQENRNSYIWDISKFQIKE